MIWKSVRLELGRTNEFPNGSASRAYLLRLPLDSEGRIDEAALENLPEQATVRRLWPSEPDLSGHLVKEGSRWAFVARNSQEVISAFDPLAFRVGQTLELEERGRRMPFRVAKLGELELRRA
jgi:hypothetical protein